MTNRWFHPVPELQAVAGSSRTLDAEKVIGAASFGHDWLKNNNINPVQCVVISVAGESMEPTLPGGSSILVDRSRRRRRNDHIYVLRTGDGIVVKRLERGDDDQWQVISDHPAWPPQPWDDGNEIIGEVRWAAWSVP